MHLTDLDVFRFGHAEEELVLLPNSHFMVKSVRKETVRGEPLNVIELDQIRSDFFRS